MAGSIPSPAPTSAWPGSGWTGWFARPTDCGILCALRWYSVGKLLYEARFAHLDAEELRDFRVQFGDTWQLVQTVLGHRSVTTTMEVYRYSQ